MDRITRSLLIGMLLVVSGLARPSWAADQQLTFSTPVGTVRAGDLVMIDVLLTNTSAAVNAVNLELSYPTSLLQIEYISRDRSALTLWPVAPTWDETTGTIRATGGLPNGLYASQARLFTIVATAKQAGLATMTLATNRSAAYLNDGAGTAVKFPAASTTIDVSNEFVPAIAITSLSHPSAQTWSRNATVQLSWPIDPNMQYSYSFSLDGATLPDDGVHLAEPQTYPNLADGRYVFLIKSRPIGGSWSTLTQRWFLIDRTPPEPFQLLHPDPSTVGGHQILSWSVLDRESGVVSAQLSVAGVQLDGPLSDKGVVSSPLPLNSKWAGHKITITVFDQAGNRRSASWMMPGHRTNVLWYYLVGGICMALIFIPSMFWWSRRRYIR